MRYFDTYTCILPQNNSWSLPHNIPILLETCIQGCRQKFQKGFLRTSI